MVNSFRYVPPLGHRTSEGGGRLEGPGSVGWDLCNLCQVFCRTSFLSKTFKC